MSEFIMTNQRTFAHILDSHHFNGTSVPDASVIEQGNEWFVVLLGPFCHSDDCIINAGLSRYIQNDGAQSIANITPMLDKAGFGYRGAICILPDTSKHVEPCPAK